MNISAGRTARQINEGKTTLGNAQAGLRNHQTENDGDHT